MPLAHFMIFFVVFTPVLVRHLQICDLGTEASLHLWSQNFTVGSGVGAHVEQAGEPCWTKWVRYGNAAFQLCLHEPLVFSIFALEFLPVAEFLMTTDL